MIDIISNILSSRSSLTSNIGVFACGSHSQDATDQDGTNFADAVDTFTSKLFDGSETLLRVKEAANLVSAMSKALDNRMDSIYAEIARLKEFGYGVEGAIEERNELINELHSDKQVLDVATCILRNWKSIHAPKYEEDDEF